MPLLAQQADIFQTYIIYDVNGQNNAFRAGGINADNATPWRGTNLGTPTSLVLNGGEIKTYKNNGGDVTGAEMWYRVYEQNATPPSFSSINLPFSANLPNPGDQRWQQPLAGINILNGLGAGTYNLEVYWQIHTNLGARFDSDFGNNFIGTFSVAGAPVPTMSQWELIILALLFMSYGAIVVFRRQPTQVMG